MIHPMPEQTSSGAGTKFRTAKTPATQAGRVRGVRTRRPSAIERKRRSGLETVNAATRCGSDSQESQNMKPFNEWPDV